MKDPTVSKNNVAASFGWHQDDEMSATAPATDEKSSFLESLEWLLCSEEATFASEEHAQRRERQFDLLLWLLHLEPRLDPYPDPHAG